MERPRNVAPRGGRARVTTASVVAVLAAAVMVGVAASPAASSPARHARRTSTTAAAARHGRRAAASSISCPTSTYTVAETFVANYAGSANGQALDLDEYQPSGVQTKVPGVILVHGGGWAKGNFTSEAGDSLTTIGDCLAENGFDAFSVDYALSVNGKGSFPENLQDINDAIAYVKANVSNLDTSKLFVLGTSAGGNLADLAGENAMGIEDGLLGVMSQSGPADLAAMGCTSSSACGSGSPGKTIEQYLKCYDSTTGSCTLYYTNGTTPVSPATLYADASPTASLSQSVPAPPFLLANSSDEEIPLAQATDMAQLLNQQCSTTGSHTPTEFVALPGDQHALTYSDIVAGPMLDFLNAVLQGTLPKACTTLSPLTGSAMAYDANSAAQSAISFGGCCTASGLVSGATDVFDTTTDTWDPVTISGSSPLARVGATLGFDPTSGDVVLFGGEYLPGGSQQPEALDDTWELSYKAATNTGTWTQVDGSGCTTACTGGPPARYGGSADEAPHNLGLVLFGGENLVPADQAGQPVALGDTWLWNGTWSELAPTGAPPARYGAVLAYDGVHNADVLFGGDNATSSCSSSCLALKNDTWTLTENTTSGAWTWAKKAAAPTALTARQFAAGASGATGAMLFGGMSGTTGTNVNTDQLLGDTWTWNGSKWTQACTTCTTTPPATFGAGLAYHRTKKEDLLYGGYGDAAAPAPPATTWIWNGSWNPA